MKKRNSTDICEVVLLYSRKNISFLTAMMIMLLFLNACAAVKPIGMATEQVSVPKLEPQASVFGLRPLL